MRQAICPAHHRQRVLTGCPTCDQLRAQQAFAMSLATWQPWHVMTTLTFDAVKATAPVPPGTQRHGGRLLLPARLAEEEDGDRGPRRPVTVDAAVRRVEGWLKRGQKELGRPVKAFVALESHRSGEPHFHGLLSVAGGLVEGDELLRLWRLWFERNGAAQLDRPASVDHCASYGAKYIAKEVRDSRIILWPNARALRQHEW